MDLLGSSAIVETAIGLALVFFLAAGICTAVVEAVASLFSFRGKLLWRTVALWFGSVDEADARKGISKAFSLFKPGVGASDEKRIAAAAATHEAKVTAAETAEQQAILLATLGAGPVQLEKASAVATEARSSADSLMAPTAPEVANGLGDRFMRSVLGRGAAPDITKAAVLGGRGPRQEFIAALPGVADQYRVLKKTKHINRESAIAALAGIFASTNGLTPDQLATQIGKAIDALPVAIGDELEQRAKWVEQWFDAEMVKLEAAYRSRVRWYAGFVGLLLTLFLGLDAIQMTTDLYREPARRTVLVAAAEKQVEAGDLDCGEAEDPMPIERAREQVQCATELLDQVEGFEVGRWIMFDRYRSEDAKPADDGQWAFAILGMGITVGAMAAGAPWWFSVLKRLMGLRKQLTGSD